MKPCVGGRSEKLVKAGGEAVFCGKRILVVGCCGSGKSTLARRLAAMTGLPLIHLDNLWWRPDKTHISREEFDRQLEALLKGERWILDGDYSRTYEARIRACDTVIFLDYGEAVCMEGIRARVGLARPDMPWTADSLAPELVEMVENYGTEVRPKLLALLQAYPVPQRLIFHTREEAEEWLQLSAAEL